MQQPAGPPPGRYGPERSGPRPGLVALVVVVAAAFVGWVVWAALGASAPAAAARVTGFDIASDEQIEVRVQAAPGASGQFACRVRALDRTRDVVGVATVRLDVDRDADAEQRVAVRTRARAVTATVGDCAGEQD